MTRVQNCSRSWRTSKLAPAVLAPTMFRPACSSYVQALDGLAGDVSYHIEVLAEMPDGESGKFCGRSDDQVRSGRCPMLASVGERVRTSTARSSRAAVVYSTAIEDSGGRAKPERRSGPER